MPSGLYEEKVQDAVQQRKQTWLTERAAVKEVENEFYKTALETDKQLQADVMHEINELRRKQAEEHFNQWKQNPGKVRLFWDQIKSRLLYFNRN